MACICVLASRHVGARPEAMMSGGRRLRVLRVVSLHRGDRLLHKRCLTVVGEVFHLPHDRSDEGATGLVLCAGIVPVNHGEAAGYVALQILPFRWLTLRFGLHRLPPHKR